MRAISSEVVRSVRRMTPRRSASAYHFGTDLT
jgi:hypothetical protein